MKSLLALVLISVPEFAHGETFNISQLYPTALPSVAVASLPVCSAALQGVSYLATDALLPAFLGTVVGGGAVKVRVLCDGTNWTVQ